MYAACLPACLPDTDQFTVHPPTRWGVGPYYKMVQPHQTTRTVQQLKYIMCGGSADYNRGNKKTHFPSLFFFFFCSVWGTQVLFKTGHAEMATMMFETALEDNFSEAEGFDSASGMLDLHSHTVSTAL